MIRQHPLVWTIVAAVVAFIVRVFAPSEPEREQDWER